MDINLYIGHWYDIYQYIGTPLTVVMMDPNKTKSRFCQESSET